VTRRWRGRIATAVAVWVVVSLLMAAMQMDPSPVLIAGLVGVAAGGLCLVLDVSDVASPVSWGADRAPEGLRRGGDVRVRTLQGQLQQGRNLDDGRALHGSLVEIVDDRLLTEHGIDRTADPERAAAVLGPPLTAFVTNPPPSRRLGDPAYLAAILDRIEAL
jgi:hypothetical protein